jgi:acetyl esterase/lipase
MRISEGSHELDAGNLRKYVAETVSPEWHAYFAALPDPETVSDCPGPDDFAGWAALHADFEIQRREMCERAVERTGVTVTPMNLGGVPVLEIIPKDWNDDGNVLVYCHGGAYTFFTARSTLTSSATAAAGTGMRVISIDYTNPPAAQWQQVTDEVVTVFETLVRQGFESSRIGACGDSAGAALVAGSVLKMRDLGRSLPAAIVLWSPWADITETGETYRTLKAAEPAYIYEKLLAPAAAAYADSESSKHPYVSPVYGDYSKGFPPTLIQGGTREIFLSNFVRLYRSIEDAGGTAVLDLYEGMPHVFQNKLPETKESITALAVMKRFLRKHLGR